MQLYLNWKMVAGAAVLLLDIAAMSNWQKLFQGQPELLNDTNALGIHIVLGMIGALLFAWGWLGRKKRG